MPRCAPQGRDDSILATRKLVQRKAEGRRVEVVEFSRRRQRRQRRDSQSRVVAEACLPREVDRHEDAGEVLDHAVRLGRRDLAGGHVGIEGLQPRQQVFRRLPRTPEVDAIPALLLKAGDGFQ